MPERTDRRSVVMLGTFGLRPKGTMSARALPMAQELTRQGWSVRLILAPWDWPADAGTRQWIGPVEVINVDLSGGLLAITARMLAAARAEGRSLIHCFKPKGYGGLVALALRRAGWPLVIDNDDWEGPGGWNDRAGYSAAQRLVFAWQARTLPHQAAALTVASQALIEQLFAQGLPSARLHYVPNALAVDRYRGWQRPAAEVAAAERAARGLGSGPLVALYTRFDVVAPARVVALLAALRRRLPTVRLLIVGQGPDNEGAVLLRLAQAAGLAEAVSLTGFLDFERLPVVLGLADLAIYPIDDTCINRAKAPMKLLELLALGLPVIAEAVGEVSAYLEGGRSGRLITQGDLTALVEAATELLADPVECQRLGRAAQAFVWRDYTWPTFIDRVTQAYHQADASVG